MTFRNFLITGFKTTGLQIDGASTLDAGHQRDDAGRRRRHLGHPDAGAFERGAVHRQRTVPRCAPRRRWRPDCRLLQPRAPELPALVGGHAGRRPAHADSAAERRLLRGRDLHRRGRPEPGDDWTAGWTSYPAAMSSVSTRSQLFPGATLVVLGLSLLWGCGLRPVRSAHQHLRVTRGRCTSRAPRLDGSRCGGSERARRHRRRVPRTASGRSSRPVVPAGMFLGTTSGRTCTARADCSCSRGLRNGRIRASSS